MIKVINKYKLTSIFISTIIADFWGSWYGYAIAHDRIIAQSFFGLVMPFLYFLQTYLFIEAKTIKERLKITGICALAMSIGSTAMLLMVK